MPKFTDKTGRTWNVELDVYTVGRLRSDCGVDLKKGGTAEALGDLIFGDPEKTGQVLWTICEEQAGKISVSPEQFAKAMNGPAIQAATDALMEAIIDFFHRSQQAAAIKSKLPSLLGKVDQAATKAIEETTDRMLSSAVTDWPASSASIPPG